MKILFNCPVAFALAHGGQAIQIQQTMAALRDLGVQVEPLRWWDENQTGDIIHYCGMAPASYIQQAHGKGIKVIVNQLFSAACNRSDAALRRQGWLIKGVSRWPFGKKIYRSMNWGALSQCDHGVVGIEAERRVLELAYHVPREKTTVVPLGLGKVFLNATPSQRTADHLIWAGTINRQKNCIPLARLARAAQVPILFVGKPFSEKDPYWAEFRQLVDDRWVRYQSHVTNQDEMVGLLQRARGAVVISQYENWCLTAHEAAACGLPVLLPPLRWAHERFGDQARYLENTAFSLRNVEILKQFHADAPGLPVPAIRLYGWEEVAIQLNDLYVRLLK